MILTTTGTQATVTITGLRDQNNQDLVLTHPQTINLLDSYDAEDIKGVESAIQAEINSGSITAQSVGGDSITDVAQAFVDISQISEDIEAIESDQSAQDITIGLNAAKVSFPEAPNDGQQYARQSQGWAQVNIPSGDHGDLSGLGDDDHPQYHNDARGDARYYQKTELDGGQLDNRYYTESEIDTQQGDQDAAIGATTVAIAAESTARSSADTNLQNQIDSNDTDITNLQNEQATQDSAIALNTAKVSADGPISSHSDVNDAGRATGDQLVFDGTEYIPQSITNGFTIFPIWAEESGAINNGSQQYSFGNGATGEIGIPIPLDCELFAVSMQADSFGTSLSIDFEKNGSAEHTQIFLGELGSFNLAIPVQFAFGDLITFRTNTEVGAYSDVRVCAWFRKAATLTLAKTTTMQVSATGVNFISTGFADVAGASTTVTLTRPGTITGTATYSASRSGAANSVAQFRVVIDSSNGDSFTDTLSTFNDNGSVEHFLENQAAGTYTVKVQAAVTQPISIATISLKATAAED